VKPASKPTVSVVVPSWNTLELTRIALEFLYRSTHVPHQVVVVDNGSEDGSADMIAREFPEVELVRNARNEGFAIACNQGMRVATGEYVLLLNTDTEMHPEALAKMVAWLEAHPDFGAAAPRLVHRSGATQRTCMAFPTLATPLFFATPFERWFPNSRELVRYFMREWSHEDSRDVVQPPAAVLLVKKQALDQVGLFDERLWLFYNDVDLSKRLGAAGWKTRYVADATVVHHVGASTSRFAGFLSQWHHDRLVYFRKHHGGVFAGLWVKACVTFTIADLVVRSTWARLRGRAAEPLAPILAAYRRFLGQ
jgi:hypothetical protein